MGAPFPAPTVFVGALLLAATGATSDCPERCTCEFTFYNQMTCDMPNNMTITVEPTSIDDIKITCLENFQGSISTVDGEQSVFAKEHQELVFNIEDLPELGFGLDQPVRLQLMFCPFPPSFAQASKKLAVSAIEELYIHHAPVSANVTPDSVKGLDHLKTLAFYSTQFNEGNIPSAALAKLPSLDSLTINNSNLTLRLGDFDSVPNLTYLELFLCNITSLPDGIFANLGKLKKLFMYKNELQELTEEQLRGLVSLEQLELSNNRLRSLRGLAAITAPLNVLAANKNLLEELPPLRNLQKLEKIFIHDNFISLNITSQALASLPALKTVDLSGSNIAALPADFLTGTPLLQTLTLKRNLLVDLPDQLFTDQKSLETLDLSGNQLRLKRSFPPSQSLKTLVLDNNNMTFLPPSFISGLPNLVSLSVAHNLLQTVKPTHLKGARNLTDVNFSYNNIENPEINTGEYFEFSSAFAQLTQLKNLDLSHNKLTAIPYGVGTSAVYLETLNLSHNHVKELLGAGFSSDKVTVDVRSNNISTVYLLPGDNSSVTMQPNQIHSTMKLDDNPFKCDCMLYAFAQRFHNFRSLETSETRFEINDAKCVEPPELAGRILSSVPLNDFVCDLSDNCTDEGCPEEGCPDGCTCLYRTYTNSLEWTCKEPPNKYPDIEKSLRVVLRLTETPTVLNLDPVVRTLNLTGLGLQSLPPGDIQNITLLDLSNNRFTSIPRELYRGHDRTLKLLGNPFICDCSHSDDVALLQEFSWKIQDYNEVNCTGKVPIRQKDVQQLCSTRRAAVIGGVLAMFGLLAIIAAILILKYSFEIKVWLYTRGMFSRWFVIDDDDRQYDAFLSFCHKDDDFVKKNLIPSLENIPQPYKLCIHYRDWMPGEFITTQIAQSVADSRRTIIVVSKNFLESQWARAEFRTANMSAIKERKTRVIVILLEDVNSHKELDPELKAYLSTNTYLKWGDPWFWDKLRYALPHRKANLKRPIEKASMGRADEARKVLRICGLDTKLTADGVIVNAAALDNKKHQQISLNMTKLNQIRPNKIPIQV